MHFENNSNARASRGENMTRVDVAVLEIKDMILKKRYDEMGYLPSEGELSEILRVSRATIREAIRTLEVRGFVKRIHGKGICVVDKGQKVMIQAMTDMFEKKEITLNEVLEVRSLLETQAAELAAKRITNEEKEELKAIVQYMEGATQIDEKYLKSDFEFHQKLAYCAKNSMLAAIVCAYSGWLRQIIDETSNTNQDMEKNYHYHREIYEAVASGNSEIARKCMENHLAATYKNVKTDIWK